MQIMDTIASIFDVSKSTIVGFAFCGEPLDEEYLPCPNEFQWYPNREIPTVLVKMDINIRYSISQSLENVIPFVAVCDISTKYMSKFHRW